MWSSYKVNELIRISEFYSLFEQYYPSDYVFSGESHNFWECVYVIEGNISAAGDDCIYNMKEHEMIFHKPLELHKFNIDCPTGARLFIFSFSMEGDAINFFANKVFKLNDTQLETINHFLKYLRQKEHICTEMDCLLYMNNFVSSTHSQMVTTYIYQLFLSLFDNSIISPASKSGDAKIFSDAVNYMNTNICSMPTTEEISKACSVSHSGLKRIFAKYTGISIHKYFLTMKINTAAQMLEKGISITEISEKLGFSSQAYFSFVFKRETGYPPSEYHGIFSANNL